LLAERGLDVAAHRARRLDAPTTRSPTHGASPWRSTRRWSPSWTACCRPRWSGRRRAGVSG
jgi:hypothetical protein